MWLDEGMTSAEHSTWTTSSTESVSDWSFSELAYFLDENEVHPVDDGIGLAYVFYGTLSEVEREDHLTSGHINIENAVEPKISFHIYGKPGYDSQLGVAVSTDDGEFVPVKELDFISDFDNEGWQKLTIDLDLPKDAKKMQMRFTARKYIYSCSVIIDNIMVYDNNSNIADALAEGIDVSADNGIISISGTAGNLPVFVYSLDGSLVAEGRRRLHIPCRSGHIYHQNRQRTGKEIDGEIIDGEII